MEILKIKAGLPTSAGTSYINDIESRLLYLESKQTADQVEYQELNARIDTVESDKNAQSTAITRLETNRTFHIALIQDHSSRITQLESDRTTDQISIQLQMASIEKLEANLMSDGAVIKNQGDILLALNNSITLLGSVTNEHNISLEADNERLAQLEEDMQLQESRITALETENTYDVVNTTLSSRIANLESDRNSNQHTIFNNTLRIKQLEKILDEHNSSFEMENRILRLESEIATNHAKVEESVDRIRLLEENVPAENVLSQNQSSITNKLELEITSMTDAVKNQSDTIDHLQDIMHAQNTSLYAYISLLEELESNRFSDEANQTIRITDLEISRQSHNSTIQEHNTRLLELELEVNLTQHTLQKQSNTLTDITGKNIVSGSSI